MEYGNSSKPELAAGKKALLLLLLLFAAFHAALHISCLFLSSGSSPCMVAEGAFNVKNAALKDGHEKLAITFDNAGIYAFTAVSSTITSATTSDGSGGDGGGSSSSSGDTFTALKLLYSSKFHDGESLVPSNSNLRKLWTSKDWRIKVSIFSDLFSDIMKKDLLKPCVKALCIGAGQGHEVLALKEMGVHNSIGIDLVASPPLVMKGDMHSQPFRKDTFDFEFSNVFDHALLTSMFAAEIERTLKPGGCVAIHLMLRNRTGEAYRPNNLQSFDVLIALFRNFDVVHVGDIDAFGLDTEVIFRKPSPTKEVGLAK